MEAVFISLVAGGGEPHVVQSPEGDVQRGFTPTIQPSTESPPFTIPTVRAI